ncbi:AAA family ATPase [Candidatus Roizmanbacteria bacterium]|nr:AAA family ATPase [Candidatus Roizmanbacteria bacterium]
MNIDQVQGYTLNGLSKINILLGKNGCGKSTCLKKVENGISPNQDIWGITRYITPERGGTLIYEAGIEQNLNNDPNWILQSRRVNQLTQFRQQSIAQYRKLEITILREIASTRRNDHEYTFDLYIDKINSLLDNIEIRPDGITFKIFKKGTDTQIDAAQISSGESELVSLGIECLIFAKEAVPDKNNILFLDEPDVHLHPDLQSRLMTFLKQLVDENNFTIIIATHSTAILGELSEYEHATVGFMKSGETTLNFKPINGIYKKVLPVFGAHPLSNIFNEAPVLLVEGEDDERIWQQAVRTSVGKIKVYPVACEGIQEINDFEQEAKDILNSVYENAKAYSLRDRDDTQGEINDELPIIRMKLSCRTAENLILTNQVLQSLTLTWDAVKQKIDDWLSTNQAHSKFTTMQSFKDGVYARKDFDLKDIRMLLVGSIFATNKPWEVLVGQTLGNLKKTKTINYDEDGSIFSYLGQKVVENLIPDNT